MANTKNIAIFFLLKKPLSKPIGLSMIDFGFIFSGTLGSVKQNNPVKSLQIDAKKQIDLYLIIQLNLWIHK
jgi:hypothetical protein